MQQHSITRLTGTSHFWRVLSSSVVPLKTRTHRCPTLCTVTVGRTGKASATSCICPCITSYIGKEKVREKGNQTGTEEQTDKQTDRQTDRHRQTDLPTHK